MMITMICKSAIAVRFPSSSNFCSSSSVPYYRSLWTSQETTGVHFRGRRSSCLNVARGYQKFGSGGYVLRRKSKTVRKKVRVTSEHLGSAPDPAKCNRRSEYHPFEAVAELASIRGEDACLTPAETARTIVEVNSKSTLLFSGLVNEEVHKSIFWPELPYVNDGHGNIYFRVKTEEDILQNVASEDNVVMQQLIIGLDATGLINEMEVSGPAEIDFGIEEIDDEDDDAEDEGDEDDDEDEDSSENDDYYPDWVSVLEDEDDGSDSDEDPGDWATLETMRSAHPMDFAKKLAEVSSDEPVDWMEGPPFGICIQGVLRPAPPKENSIIEKLFSDNSGDGMKDIDDSVDQKIKLDGVANGDGKVSAWDLDLGNGPKNGKSYYTLDLAKIELISVHGHPDTVEVEDFLKAKPDAIAHSSDDIVSHLKAGGEKTIRALKAMCWRCKGIQVELIIPPFNRIPRPLAQINCQIFCSASNYLPSETRLSVYLSSSRFPSIVMEAQIVRVDSLGFDVRVCSGTQLQTLRFAFDTPATSESCAERKLNNLLFPKSQPRPQKTKRVHRSDG